MTDLISDMLTRIRNAVAVNRPFVKVAHSNVCWELVKILQKHHFIKEAQKVKHQGKRFIKIYLDYDLSKKPIINNLKRISKPSQRIYKKAKELKPVRQGYGIGIVSTSQGLMTYAKARKNNLGGEVICEIW